MSRAPWGDASAIERLRREALGDRPAFDADVHARILSVIRRRVDRSATVPSGHAASRWPAMLVTCLVLGGATRAWWGDHGPANGHRDRPTQARAVAAGSEPALDALPGLEEIGDDVSTGLGMLAAAAVGLPEWQDLAVAGLPGLAAWQNDLDAGGAGWPVADSAVPADPR